MKQDNEFAGAWELVHGYAIDEQGVKLEYSQSNMKAQKILSNNRYCFVSMNDKGFYAAASGRYELEGNTYTERAEAASYASMIGARFQFEYEISDGVWTNRRWKDGAIVEYEEWKRV